MVNITFSCGVPVPSLVAAQPPARGLCCCLEEIYQKLGENSHHASSWPSKLFTAVVFKYPAVISGFPSRFVLIVGRGWGWSTAPGGEWYWGLWGEAQGWGHKALSSRACSPMAWEGQPCSL